MNLNTRLKNQKVQIKSMMNFEKQYKRRNTNHQHGQV